MVDHRPGSGGCGAGHFRHGDGGQGKRNHCRYPTGEKSLDSHLLAALYNASVTMGSYYSALVQHDLAEGG